MSEEISKIESDIVSLFKDECEFIITFGSITKAQEFKATSDIDVAIYLKDFSKLTKKIDFKNRLDKITSRNCDLIILNQADIIITMQILMNGKTIELFDEKKFIKYKASKISEYIEFKEYRKELEDKLIC